jgi:hypothetical protein
MTRTDIAWLSSQPGQQSPFPQRWSPWASCSGSSCGTCEVVVLVLRPSGVELLTRVSGLLVSSIAVQLIAGSVEAFVRGTHLSATLQVLPILPPWRRTPPATCGQLWNIGPAQRPHRTVLDDVPTPTDLKVACPLRADEAVNQGNSRSLAGIFAYPLTYTRTGPGLAARVLLRIRVAARLAGPALALWVVSRSRKIPATTIQQRSGKTASRSTPPKPPAGMPPANNSTVAAIARMLGGSVTGRSLPNGLLRLTSPASRNPQLHTAMPTNAPSRCRLKFTSSGTRPTRTEPAAAASSRHQSLLEQLDLDGAI